MMSCSSRLLTGAAVAALALTGCGTDPVGSSTAAMSVRYVPSPPGGGRFDEGTMNIIKIGFEPTDPDLVPLLGGNLSMRFGVYVADLLATSSAEYAQIALPPGSYRITELTFRPPLLQDAGTSQAAPLCIERIALIPSGPAAFEVPTSYTLDASDGFGFTVGVGQTQVQILADIPGLLASYEAAFTCSPSCGGGNACLTAFDADAFRAAFVTHISFQ